MRKVKFGVFADLHVDIMHDTQERLQVFLDACRQENVDFIIELGDFCYPDDNRRVVCKPEHMPVNIANALRVKTYADKPMILKMFNDFEKPSYHVLGNHDCDMCAKQEQLKFLEAKNGSYYSFDHGGFHFVVLDTNYVKTDSGEYIAYENGNYFEAGYRDDMVRENVSPDQIAWLKEDLAKAENPAVIFSHASFSNMAPRLSAKNRMELREIFQSAPNGVVACLNGHEHLDAVAEEEGIWYVQINSMDCQWVDLEFMQENLYGPEIDEKYPNIKYTAPYKDPVFAIITMDDKGMEIKGRQSEFVGADPEKLGFYEEGTPWTKDYGYRKYFSTPSQEDRYLPFRNYKG